jgi:hypothetical protein
MEVVYTNLDNAWKRGGIWIHPGIGSNLLMRKPFRGCYLIL